MVLGMTRYQWFAVLAAWLGWGFDVFDALLFNYVAPNCIPVLLDLPLGSEEAKRATFYWTGVLTSLLLAGWAVGGVLFGVVADRIGRTRTLMITILMYALGTTACAFAPSLEWLIFFRAIASLGIGGEWAAGATLVAETVPESRRVEAGVLLQTASPLGLFLATAVNYYVAGVWFADQPEISWRIVFLFGLLPAGIVLGIRWLVREPERWARAEGHEHASVRELFSPALRGVTLSAFLMSFIVLVTWWSCNAFIPVVATGLAQASAETHGLDRAATFALIENWKLQATTWFNLGGLIGGLLMIPVVKALGRRPMFVVYLSACAIAIWTTFGFDLPPDVRIPMYFLVGLTVYGLACAFPFYLPELFPTRVRATGAGFCYNVGRLVAASGPFLVGAVAVQGTGGLNQALAVLSFVAIAPLVGVAFFPWIVETRGRQLAD
jgi:MFS family permease